MDKSRVIVLAVLLAGALVAVPGQAVTFEHPVPSSADPLEIALQHLQRNQDRFGLTADDLADVSVQDRVTSRGSGITHIYLRQAFGGLEVANAQVNVNVAADGQVISSGSSFVGNLRASTNTLSPELSAADAIRAAASGLGLEITGQLEQLGGAGGVARETRFSGAGLSLSEIPAKLSLYATEGGSVRLAWDLVIQTSDQKHHWNLWVDAVSGEVLAKSDWMAWDTYEVFELPKESPLDGPRTIQTNPANATASPFGWHDTNGVAGAEFTTTTGNNVCAQEDRDANNSACGTGFQPASATLDFQFPLDLATQQPSEYQAAAITNLFYWNNIVHDLLYQYGFDEASGNFQENNYGRGGSGSDSVNADAQDGSGTNNANFSTPPDGSNPRMQMFEWTAPFVNELVVDAPSSAAGAYLGSEAAFGPALNTTGQSGAIKLANDGVGTVTDGCESFPAGFFAGSLALIDRGTCSFVTKVRNAQNAGALAVVMVNNVGGNPITMGDDGTGADIVIPSMMIRLSDGDLVKTGLPANGTERRAPTPPPNRDSDLDAGIIAHEYCHGLSIRLTGGANTSNCLSGNQQAGEGWSDLCTLFFTASAADTSTTPRGVGNYAIFETADGPGIRPFPYTTDIAVNPLTYGDLTTAGQTGGLSIPHGVGTVWATAVWEVYWNLVNKHGFDANLYNGVGGNNLAIRLVVDGLKLQPCNPTFLDARDAILLADLNNNGGANQCEIWNAFAKRGMGVNASDGGTSNSLNVVENFDVPPECVTGCGNGVCEPSIGEDCNTCPGDCVGGTSSGAVCGNGVCEAGDGEDCVTCPADCNGTQGGRPANRFCCGNGGQNPVGCDPTLCGACTLDPVPGGGTFCCGDTFCDAGEDCGNCAADCTVGAEVCTGGIDEDCNGAIDCADNVCSSDPACQTSCGNGICEPGEDCTTCSDCAGQTGGRPANRFCCGNGVPEGPEGDGTICDGNF